MERHRRALFAIVTILCCAVVLSGAAACAHDSDEGDNAENESYAVFVYMSGANLETASGAAGAAAEELAAAKLYGNVEVYIQAGGAEKWHSPLLKGEGVSRYKAENNSLTLLESYGDANMGDPAVLRDFAAFAGRMEADRKVLLFWGHGSPYGICPDELHGNDNLTYAELHTALTDSHFDLIIFNACYTANIDLMTYIEDFADYAIASEETFPSLGYDYTAMIGTFAQNKRMDVKNIGKQIIDDTLNKYKDSPLKDTVTLSLIDLNALRGFTHDFKDYFNSLLSNTAPFHEWLKCASNANGIGDVGKDFTDLNRSFSEDYDYISSALDKIVVYEIHGERNGLSGLYLYYTNAVTSADLARYSQNCAYPEYLSLLRHRSRLSEQQYITILNAVGYPDGDKICRITIDELGVYYSALFDYVFYDENGNILKSDVVGLWSEYDDASGNSYLSLDRRALYELSFGGNSMEYRVLSVQDIMSPFFGTQIIYTAPVSVNGVQGDLYFSYTYPEDYSDSDRGYEYDGTYTIMGFVPDGDGYMEQIDAGDVVICGGNRFVYSDQQIVRTAADNAAYVALQVLDIYGREYTSVQFKVN